MKITIIKYNDDIAGITNDFDKWIKENNKQRIKDGNDVESKDDFEIEEISADIY